MKKRPKLSVSSSKVDKKQAAGFDPAPAGDLDVKPNKPAEEKPAISASAEQMTNPEQMASAERVTSAERVANPEQMASAEQLLNEAGLQKPGWANGKQILKAVLVIAATAASLYLLKRRFF